jgi:hypothetical protein
MYTKSASQPTDSSTISRILNVAEGVATRKAAETKEDRTTTTILGNPLSDAEDVVTYKKISQLETLSKLKCELERDVV